MKLKKFTEDLEPTYDDHVVPEVKVPTKVRQTLTDKEVRQIKTQSLFEYRASKKALEASIADVAVHDEGALDFAGDLAQRILTIMDIAVELGLAEMDGVDADRQKLLDVGISTEAIDSRSEGLLRELKQNRMRTKTISESRGSEVEKGRTTESGFVGFSPLAIKNATRGSLRERMFIPYKTTHGFTKNLFANSENVSAINEKLEERGIEWRLNSKIIDLLREKTAQKRGGLYAYGAYAASRDGSRVSLSAKQRLDYAEHNPTMCEMQTARMPLSDRELLAQSGDLDPSSDKRVQWLPGEAWCSVLESRDHPSLTAADETSDQMLTGVSGATDSILTLSYMIGMFDGDGAEARMRDGLVALMGWMVDARDHTAHEVLTSGKTFGLDYTAGPESYKQIRPGDSEFLERLRLAQESRGFKMPDEYLSEAYILERALPKMFEAEREEPRAAKQLDLPRVEDKENVAPNISRVTQKHEDLKAKLKGIKEVSKNEEQLTADAHSIVGRSSK